MKFCEAMDALKSGANVTRKPWSDGVYFKMDGELVKSYQPNISNFVYNEDIMVSDGWLIDDDIKEYKFCEIIEFLRKGSKARLKNWEKDSFIYFDFQTKSLIFSTMSIFPFTPDFESFITDDWVEV